MNSKQTWAGAGTGTAAGAEGEGEPKQKKKVSQSRKRRKSMCVYAIGSTFSFVYTKYTKSDWDACVLSPEMFMNKT